MYKINKFIYLYVCYIINIYNNYQIRSGNLSNEIYIKYDMYTLLKKIIFKEKYRYITELKTIKYYKFDETNEVLFHKIIIRILLEFYQLSKTVLLTSDNINEVLLKKYDNFKDFCISRYIFLLEPNSSSSMEVTASNETLITSFIDQMITDINNKTIPISNITNINIEISAEVILILSKKLNIFFKLYADALSNYILACSNFNNFNTMLIEKQISNMILRNLFYTSDINKQNLLNYFNLLTY
jgi:hypothetical protein